MLERLRGSIAYLLAPQAMKQALPQPYNSAFLSPLSQGGAPPRLGTRELLQAYNEMPWLRAIVNKVGKSVSSVQWSLFVEQGGNNGSRRARRAHKLQRADYATRKALLKQVSAEGNLNEIEDHPLLSLLTLGNDMHLGSVVFQVTQQHMDLVGEAYWLLERNGLGVPINIWTVPPDWIRALPTKEFPFYRIRIGAVEVHIPVTEMISFLDPDPANPYGRGSGTAKSLGDELETDEYAAKYLKQFFYNDARPPLIISGENLGRDNTERLEERWLEKHQGFWKKFRPHFLNRKVDIKEIGQSFESMQMVQIREHERDTVIQVYGFPPEKFGIVNESKRSTIAAADLFWRQDILMPRLETLRMVMQHKLVPYFDDRLIIDYELPEVNDAEHRLSVMKASAWAYNIDEWRAEASKPPLPEDKGKVYMVPVNMTPIEEHSQEDMPGANGSNEPGTDADTPPPPEEQSHIDTNLVVDRVIDEHMAEIVDKTCDEVRRKMNGKFRKRL